MFYHYKWFCNSSYSSGEFTRIRVQGQKEWVHWSVHHLMCVRVWSSFTATCPPSSSLLLSPSTEQSTHHSCYWGSGGNRLASCSPLYDHTTGSLHLLVLYMIFCWQSRCSSSSFRTCLKWGHSSGPPRPSSMKQEPSHFLSSLLWLILFFSAVATMWPILYWFILHLSPFE